MVRDFFERLLYCVTRFAMLVVGLVPIGIMTLFMTNHPGEPHAIGVGGDYALWMTPLLFFGIPIAVVALLWRMSRRAPAEDLRIVQQFKHFLWLAGFLFFGTLSPAITGIHGEHDAHALIVAAMMLPLMTWAFMQASWPRRGAYGLLWFSGFLVISFLLSMPTC